MATCYKDKQNILSYNSQKSKSHDQFDNLNLNRNNLSCPDSLNLQSFKRFSPFRNTFKKDHGNFFDGRKKEWKGKDQWSKNDPRIFVSHYSNDYSKKNETKWDKENLSTTNKSTISLNIAAYEEEKSFENNLQNAELETAAKSNKNIFDKQWNGVKRILTNGSLKYPFEYQRGDDVSKATVPEIMQYKATQHLLNPNSSNISTERNQRQNRLKSVTTTDSNESDKESVKSDANSTDTVVKTENNEQEKKQNDVRIPYTMPGVLHFLQHEWSRAELERTHWEMEKAELKARISFLQGERKGQENLKRDLVRRIKMLEYSLKQERLKIYRLTHNGEDPENLEDDDKPAFVSDVPFDIGAFIKESEAPVWERARGTLKQYLEEFGHSEHVVSLRNIGIEDSVLGNYTLNSDSSEQHSGSNDSNILNQAFYGSKEKENLDASDFLKDCYLAKPDNENNQNGNAEDENRDDDDEEDDEGQNDLDDALEALNTYSFLADEKDDHESDKHEEFSDDESPEEKETKVNALFIQSLLAVIESTSPSPTSASTAEAPSSTSAHEEEEDEDSDIKNDSFLGESEL